jgi:hypothetical protein
LPYGVADAAKRTSSLGRLSWTAWARPALFVCVAGVVIAAGREYAAYEIAVWAPLGIALVAVCAVLVASGRRPPTAVALAAAALVALGAWSLASTVWGGLPNEAWTAFDQAVLGAAALTLGSLLTRDLRAVLPVGVLVGVTAQAVEVIVRLALDAYPSSWVDDRVVIGPVGDHNTQAAVFAIGVPIAVWYMARAPALARVGAGAAAAVLVAGILLTQSRGTLPALALGLLVQVALARSARVLLSAALVVVAGGALGLAIRSVDVALLQPDAGERADALLEYSLVTTGVAVALGVIAVLALKLPGTRVIALGLVSTLAIMVVAAAIAERDSLPPPRDVLLELASDAPAASDPGETRFTSLPLNGRRDAWRVATGMVVEEPLLGKGQGRFTREWIAERRTDIYMLQPHSLELELLGELGVVGLGVFAAFVALVAAAALRGPRRAASATALGVATVFLAQASIDYLWSFPLLVASVLLLLGAAGEPRELRERDPRAGVRAIAVAIAAVAVATSFGAPYVADRALALAAAEPSRAWEHTESARRLNRWNPEVYALQGTIAQENGDFALAVDRYRAAERLARHAWLYEFRSARALDRAGASGASRDACRRAVLMNPREPLLLGGPCAHDVAGNVWPVVSAGTEQPAGSRPRYDAFLKDEDCSACSLRFVDAELEATIAGSVAPLDTAYAELDFAHGTDVRDAVWVRDVVRLGPGPRPRGNLSILQVRDARKELVYDVYVRGSDGAVRIFSHGGGVGPEGIDESIGIDLAPGGRGREIEIRADVNDALVVRVDGRVRLRLRGLGGTSHLTQRFLRVGAITHVDGEVFEAVRVYHRGVGVRIG